MTDEPVPPSRLNPQVPRDLATICLKCLSKEPQRRYASAAALAEDLRRFLRGETIAARPAGPLERLARWARRSPAAAALLAVTLLVAITVLGAGSWLIGRQILTARAVEADLREADRLQQQSAFPEAGAATGAGPIPGSATAGRSGCTRLWRRPTATTSSWCGSRRSA